MLERKYSKGEVALILQQFRSAHDRLPLTSDFARDTGDIPNYATMCDVFGVEKWQDLIREIFQVDYHSPAKSLFTKEQVRDLFQRYNREYKHPPRASDIKELHKTHPQNVPSVSVILRLFNGIWNDALIYSGLPVAKKSMKSALDNASGR